MNILYIESSSEISSVAVGIGKKCIAQISCDAVYSQSERIVPMISDIFKQTRLTYRDINYVGVTSGPGSFIGVRAGLAVVSAIKLSIPAIETIVINSFEILLQRSKSQCKYNHLIVCIYATPTKFYIGFIFGNTDASSVQYQIFDTYGAIDKIKNMIASQNPSDIIAIIGNGVYALYDAIKEIENVVILPRFGILEAKFAIRVMYSKILNGKWSSDLVQY